MAINLDTHYKLGLQPTDNRTTATDLDYQDATSAADTAVGKNTDTVQLTEYATQLKRIEKQLAQQPDVNQEKIKQIRDAIKHGTYTINLASTVDKMLVLETSVPPK